MKNKTLLLLFLYAFTIKAQVNENNALAYIKEYYSGLKTGYDSPGGFITLTNNYKVKLENAIFTLTFDTFKNRAFVKSETIAFDLKKIKHIYNNGTDILETDPKINDSEMVIIPINDSLGFESKTQDYHVNIKYEKQAHTEETKIFKAFEVVENSFKKEK
jgi:hypothetical protein